MSTYDEADQRDDVLTPGGQHLQTPSKADQRTGEEEARREIDLDDEWQVRTLCNELRVSRAELTAAVAAVGTRWLKVREHLQQPARGLPAGAHHPADNSANAGPGHPGQHGERHAPQEGQAEQFSADMPRKAKSGQDTQEQASPPHPASRE
ncbi:MAG TPA: DUF3606 domain-containing protein [Burkholderiales bacterium]|nr:DUF3606 domain-containing protein [Burkholderiales bacterium]